MGHTEKCTCPIRPNMSYEEIRDEILEPRKMCTDTPGKRWLCPTLDKELRRAEAERYRRKYQKRKMKREGYTDQQIKEAATKPRKRRGAAAVVADLDLSDLTVL